jgi:WD40 repeat protein
MSPTNPDELASVNQTTQGNRNQVIGEVSGGTVVNVTGGGQITIYQSQIEHSLTSASEAHPAIGANPYQGLLAFQETDGDRFFGREREIAILWEKLCTLYRNPSITSVLPIYGPSGSGKSSLARAGLIPELAHRPLPGRDRARVATLVPGTRPLESLAVVLARVATNDLTPVTKTHEFATELWQANAAGTQDGLRRIVNLLPDKDVSPLILLVDQFEEVYTLCKDPKERSCFLENLLEAATEESQPVLIVITLRSDFLSEIQKHSELNRLFSGQGFLVPAMDEEELKRIIAKPAELAGHPLDESTVYLLVEDTKGREGALPLLQCALSCIWKGLVKGVAPTETLEQIGGVGGALAGEAQEVYDNLSPIEQPIARRLFLGLVQLGEGTKDTSRRIAVDCLISHKDNLEQVKQVINRFAEPGVRLITCATGHGNVETAELTHEALIDHWQLLRQWLEQSRSDLRFQRRVEEDAQYWEQNGRPEGSLWRSPDLDLLKQYQQRDSANITQLQLEFMTASQQAEETHKQEETRRQKKDRQHQAQRWVLCSLMVTGISFAGYQYRQATVQRVEQLSAFAEALLSTQPLNAQINTVAEINAIAAVGLSQSALVRLPNDSIASTADQSLLHAIQVNQGRSLLFPGVISVAFSPDGKTIASGGVDSKVRLWNIGTGKLIKTLKEQGQKKHQHSVISVAFSPDGKTIASGGVDRKIHLWDTETGKAIGTLEGHQYSVVSVAFSPDGKTLVSGSDDKTVRLWDISTRKQIKLLKGGEFQSTSIAFSPDNQTIVGRSYNNKVRLWNASTGDLLGEQQSGEISTRSVMFSADGKTIVSNNVLGSNLFSNSYGDTMRSLISPESLLQTACHQLHDSSSLREPETAVAREAQRICDRYLRNEPDSIAPQP